MTVKIKKSSIEGILKAIKYSIFAFAVLLCAIWFSNRPAYEAQSGNAVSERFLTAQNELSELPRTAVLPTLYKCADLRAKTNCRTRVKESKLSCFGEEISLGLIAEYEIEAFYDNAFLQTNYFEIILKPARTCAETASTICKAGLFPDVLLI